MTPSRAIVPSDRETVSVAIQRRNVKITPPERRRRNLEMLSRTLNLHTTIAFLGSGCSADFGLPDWQTLANKIVKVLQSRLLNTNLDDDLRADHYKDRLAQFAASSEHVGALDYVPGNRLQFI